MTKYLNKNLLLSLKECNTMYVQRRYYSVHPINIKISELATTLNHYLEKDQEAKFSHENNGYSLEKKLYSTYIKIISSKINFCILSLKMNNIDQRGSFKMRILKTDDYIWTGKNIFKPNNYIRLAMPRMRSLW